jgi:hypothetical protein
MAFTLEEERAENLRLQHRLSERLAMRLLAVTTLAATQLPKVTMPQHPGSRAQLPDHPESNRENVLYNHRLRIRRFVFADLDIRFVYRRTWARRSHI